MTIRQYPKLITLAACLLLSACAGKKAAVDEGETAPVADITRPPQMVSDKPQVEVEENNPEETISYDEWRKRRQAELEEDQP